MNPIYLKTGGDTTTVFPVPLEREGFMCKAVEIYGNITKLQTNTFSELFLCCDFCEDCYVGGKPMPVLRQLVTVNKSLTIQNPYQSIWLKVMRPAIESIRLYICDSHGNVVSLLGDELYCTLVFVPVEKKWV